MMSLNQINHTRCAARFIAARVVGFAAFLFWFACVSAPAWAASGQMVASKTAPITAPITAPKIAPITAPKIAPTTETIPENLLRISLAFDAPYSGDILPDLELVGADGAPIFSPFLPRELWSPDRRMVTLLLHPGRVKQGLAAHDHFGRPLSAGYSVGVTYQGRELVRWHVVAADRSGPDIERWQINVPPRGGTQAIYVRFDAPIDAVAVGFLAIADRDGRRVSGRGRLSEGESGWYFVPDLPWKAGRYSLRLHPLLEDVAGNRVHDSFETRAGANPVAVSQHGFSLPFEIAE